MSETADLTGQVALVTGGGRGIGRVISQHLAAAGAKVVLIGRSPAPLNETVSAISDAGGQAVAFEMDVSNSAFFCAMESPHS